MNKKISMNDIIETVDAVVASCGGEVYNAEFGALSARFKTAESAEECAEFLRDGNFVGVPKNTSFFCEVAAGTLGGEATLKVIPCRRRGAPKGNANAKKPEVEKRVALNTSIKKETRAELFRRSEEAGVSVGRIIDGLVSPP